MDIGGGWAFLLGQQEEERMDLQTTPGALDTPDTNDTKDPLKTQRLPNGKRELLAKLRRNPCGRNITVEKGFDTDYSTIPIFGRWIVHWSKVDVAGVVHDWCYRKAVDDESNRLSRKLADDIWLFVAKDGAHSANAVQAWVCWAALRIGGRCAWRQYRDEEKLGGEAGATSSAPSP
jgi:hypothetical protein